ncbi:MAG: HAMP domain-containing histidine kinase [Spirochaetes bacterium]|nr:MAG: HAMP domain-containing histidine kinase [Spirochaetota bacterium]
MNRHEYALVERLIRNLSHEFKNPLTTIKGYAQLATMSPDDAAVLKKSQDMIIAQVEKLNALLDELYRIFSAVADDRSEIDLMRVIDEIAGDARGETARVTVDTTARVTVQANVPGIRRMVGAMIGGFDWKNNPGTSLAVSVADSGGKRTIAFRYEGSSFDDLEPESFFLPCASKRHFLSSTGLYEAAVIACAHGWDLRLVNETDTSTLELVF